MSHNVAFAEGELLNEGLTVVLGLTDTLAITELLALTEGEASRDALSEGEGDGVVVKEGEGRLSSCSAQPFTPPVVRSCRQNL